MSKVITIFGYHQPTDVSNISHSIEYSFDVFRKNLENMMDTFTQFTKKIRLVDEYNHALYGTVHNEIVELSNSLPYYWEHNEGVLKDAIKPWDVPFVYGITPPSHVETTSENLQVLHSSPSFTNDDKHPSSYNTLTQIIVHLSRDWSSLGVSVRKLLYFETLLPLIEKHLPLLPNNLSPLILIPGSGLGRLGLELAALGYRIEMNECSPPMLCVTHCICSKLLPENNTLSFYPYLHYQLSDDWDLLKRLTTTTFPFIEDSPKLKRLFHDKDALKQFEKDRSLSIQYGEFLKFYGERPHQSSLFDGIVTCFFIDTAENILEYIQTIKQNLKPDGIWINAGPLHYHSVRSLPYSHRHLLQVIELSGFKILHDSKVNMTYCGEEEYSMKPELYNIPINVFVRVDSPSVNTTQ